ncbi:hypothetical protein [Algoriphagus namhaensis]
MSKNLASISPEKWFLLDGLGAMLTALITGFVLIPWQSYIGMPEPVLKFLAVTASVYMSFSLSCFFIRPQSWWIYLKGIAGANVTYGLLLVGLLIYYFDFIQAFGWIYFMGEILLLWVLAHFELNQTKTA